MVSDDDAEAGIVIQRAHGRSSRKDSGNWLQRWGSAYRKERFVILRDDEVWVWRRWWQQTRIEYYYTRRVDRDQVMKIGGLRGSKNLYVRGRSRPYDPPRWLRSSDADRLAEPVAWTATAERRFSYFAPHVWNALPSHISADSLDSFKARLKSHLFDIVWRWILSPHAPDSGFIL